MSRRVRTGENMGFIVLLLEIKKKKKKKKKIFKHYIAQFHT